MDGAGRISAEVNDGASAWPQPLAQLRAETAGVPPGLVVFLQQHWRFVRQHFRPHEAAALENAERRANGHNRSSKPKNRVPGLRIQLVLRDGIALVGKDSIA